MESLNLNVLVIEDTDRHQKAAIRQLEVRGHRVTIARNLLEAEILLEGIDLEKLSSDDNYRVQVTEQVTEKEVAEEDEAGDALLAITRLMDELVTSSSSSTFDRWDVPRLRKMYPLEAAFDVVLTDMNLPASKEGLTAIGPDVLKEGLVPFGFIFALQAAARGVKFVAMVTDTGHHHGAMSAALDAIASPYYGDGENVTFNINGARVVFVHAPMIDGDKDWGQVLDDLVADPDEGGEEGRGQVLDDLVADRPDDRGWWERLVARFRRHGR